MRSFRVLFFIIISMLSCSSDDNAFTLAIPGCNVENPLEQLDWLKTEIERRDLNPDEEMKYCYIVQGMLDGNTVFIYEDCNPLIDKAIFVYNCEGNALDSDGFAISNIVENKKIIWKPSDFVCTISS